MIRIKQVVQPRCSLEDYNEDVLDPLEQESSNMQTMAHELLRLNVTAEKNGIGTESYDDVAKRYVNVGVESVMVAAIAAAGVAVAALLYKLYKYFADKKKSDDFTDTIKTLDGLDDVDDAELVEKLDSKLAGHKGEVTLNSNIGLVAIAIKNQGNSLLSKSPSPKDFLAQIELLPSVVDVDAAHGRISDDQVKSMDAKMKEQYQYLESFCKRFKIDTAEVKKSFLVGPPTKGYADACAKLLHAISAFARTSNESPVIKVETIAREFFTKGMADTLKQSKRDVEDLEEYAEKLANISETAQSRLEQVRRKNNNLEGKSVSDSVALYLDYVRAVSLMYKTNAGIQLHVNHYISGLANDVKELVKD